jgi:hypothetical protein
MRPTDRVGTFRYTSGGVEVVTAETLVIVLLDDAAREEEVEAALLVEVED